MTVTSASGVFSLEVDDSGFRLFKAGCLLWEGPVDVGEGERKFHLGDSGWLVAEVVGQDWGLVTAVDPSGRVTGRLALTDSQSRPTWPPAHLPLLLFGEGGWPFHQEGGPFFVSWRDDECFWWLLPDGQRLAILLKSFGFIERLGFKAEFSSLRDEMQQHETEWASRSGWRPDRHAPGLRGCFPPPPLVITELPAVEIAVDQIERIEIYSHYLMVRSEKLTLMREKDRFSRDHYLDGALSSASPQAVGDLLDAIKAPVQVEPSPAQFERSRPFLLWNFGLWVSHDYPSFLVRLETASGARLQLRTFGSGPFLLPWQFRLDEGPVTETFNRDISLAVAGLLPEGFLDRVRLSEPRYGIFERPPDPVPSADELQDQNTPLVRAVLSRNLQSIRQLLAAGANPERARHYAYRRLAQAQLEVERDEAELGFLSAAERERGKADRAESESRTQELLGSPSFYQKVLDDARAVLAALPMSQ